MAQDRLQKLELTWIGKEEKREPLEPRILIEDPDYSCGDATAQNMLIHGDNLLALKTLEQDYAGRIKCIYIDPPYNTGSAFEYYDDNIEHSTWLNLMRERIVILRNLLSNDGFFCCHIDDSEGQYLKVLLDEIFGRNNYLTTFYVRVRYPDKTLKQDMDFHKEIEYIHIYRKQYGATPNRKESESNFDKFEFYFTEGEPMQTISLGGKKVEVFDKFNWSVEKREGSECGRKEIWATGSILDGNSSGRFFRDYLTGRYKNDGYGVLYKVYGIGDDSFDFRYFTGPQKEGATKGKYFQGVPNAQLESKDKKKYSPINNFYDLAGSFGNCRLEGGVDFRSGKKPEKLLNIILSHFSNENDIVLDSFLGSASTIAVAHKMKRKWIGIEVGDHAYSHCIPRMKSVISGADKTGVSNECNWKGGGGFHFYSLAPSLLMYDKIGNLVINKEYNAPMLAAALAKHEGFKYEPDKEKYWKQGRSSENDFIFTTTQFVTVELLTQIRSEMRADETLLVCCKAYQSQCASIKGITMKKIPLVLLGRCEFAKEDYSLNIVNIPMLDEPDENDFYDDEQQENEPTNKQKTLFD